MHQLMQQTKRGLNGSEYEDNFRRRCNRLNSSDSGSCTTARNMLTITYTILFALAAVNLKIICYRYFISDQMLDDILQQPIKEILQLFDGTDTRQVNFSQEFYPRV